MNDTALIIVDMQNDYFQGGRFELAGTDLAAVNAAKALEAFRHNGGPVFHVQHVSMQPGATFFLPDSDGAEIHASVKPKDGESVVIKHYPNSFRDTGLLEGLREKGVKRLVIAGAMSFMCIDATVRAAWDFGFECVVLHDACAARDLEFNGTVLPAEHAHGTIMAALSMVYAEVISTAEYLG